MDVREMKDAASELFRQGRFGKAAALYHDLSVHEPQEAQHLMREGDCHRREGQKDKAIDAYSRAATQLARAGMTLKAIAAHKLVLGLHPQHAGTLAELQSLGRQRVARGGAAALAALDPGDTAPHAKAAAKPAEKPKKREIPTSIELDEPEPPEPPPPPPEMATPPPADPVEIDLGMGGATGVPSAVAAPVPPPPLASDSETTAEEAIAAIGLALQSAPASEGPPPIENIELPPVESFSAPVTTALTPMESVLSASLRQAQADQVEGAELLPVIEPEAEPGGGGVAQERIPLFHDLPQEAFVELLRDSVLQSVAPGEVIVREGDPGVSLFVIVKGTAKVTKGLGDQTVDLGVLEDGAFFGEMSLLSGGPRMASVTATSEADVIEIPQSLLHQLARAYPEMAQSVLRFYRDRLLANVVVLSPLFHALDPSDRAELVEKFLVKELPVGATAMVEGEKPSGLHVVLSGTVLVTKLSPDGTARRMATLHEGDVFGEMSLLSRGRATATVTASRPTILLTLAKSAFDEVIMVYPMVLEAISALSDARRTLNDRVLNGTEAPRGGSLSIV